MIKTSIWMKNKRDSCNHLHTQTHPYSNPIKYIKFTTIFSNMHKIRLEFNQKIKSNITHRYVNILSTNAYCPVIYPNGKINPFVVKKNDVFAIFHQLMILIFALSNFPFFWCHPKCGLAYCKYKFFRFTFAPNSILHSQCEFHTNLDATWLRWKSRVYFKQFFWIRTGNFSIKMRC